MNSEPEINKVLRPRATGLCEIAAKRELWMLGWAKPALNCVWDFGSEEQFAQNKDWWLNANVFSCGNKLTTFCEEQFSCFCRLQCLIFRRLCCVSWGRITPALHIGNHSKERELCYQRKESILKNSAWKCFESQLFKDFLQSVLIDCAQSGASVIKSTICAAITSTAMEKFSTDWTPCKTSEKIEKRSELMRTEE